MKKFKNLLTLLLAFVLLSVFSFGCLPKPAVPNGSQAREDGEEGTSSTGTDLTVAMPLDERENVTLDVWYAVSGTSGEKFVEQAEAFDKQSDLVSLNLSYSGGANDTATKVAAALLTDTQPDVALMYAGASYTGSLGNFDTGQLIQREGFNADDIYPGIWDYCRYYTGGICAVPYGISTPVLYYNKAIVEAAGVDMTNPPKTWDELYEVLKICKEKGNVNGMEGFTAFDTSDVGWLFKSMLMQNDCPVVEVNDGVITPVFNNAEAVEVAEYWKKLVDEGLMAANEHSSSENKFLAGNLAFLVMSSNRISRWTEVDIEIGAIEMPYFKTQSVALGGTVLTIFTQDEQKIEAAWDLVSYLLEPQQNLDFALSTGYLPVRASELEDEKAVEAIEENEMYSIAFNQMPYAWAYVHFEQMGTMDLQLADALSRIEKGTKDPQTALNDALNTLVEDMEYDNQ